MPTKRKISCPSCQIEFELYANPFPTVDIIIEIHSKNNFEGIVLIERKNEPYGWAIPGGFIDYGESAENAAIREAKEETNLDVKLGNLLGVYSDPNRDPRFHTISTVFVAKANGMPLAGDDAKDLSVFKLNELPSKLAFDHAKILNDYVKKF